MSCLVVALFFAAFVEGLCASDVLSVMVHKHSAAKLELRRRRALALGFVKPNLGEQVVWVPDEVAPAIRAASESLQLHLDHDKGSTKPYHFARLATRGASSRGEISDAQCQAAERAHRLANRRKHCISSRSRAATVLSGKATESTTASSGNDQWPALNQSCPHFGAWADWTEEESAKAEISTDLPILSISETQPRVVEESCSVEQLVSEVNILDRMQANLKWRFDQLEEHTEKRLAVMDAKLVKIVDGLSEKFGKVASRLEDGDSCSQALGSRIDEVAASVASLKSCVPEQGSACVRCEGLQRLCDAQNNTIASMAATACVWAPSYAMQQPLWNVDAPVFVPEVGETDQVTGPAEVVVDAAPAVLLEKADFDVLNAPTLCEIIAQYAKRRIAQASEDWLENLSECDLQSAGAFLEESKVARAFSEKYASLDEASNPKQYCDALHFLGEHYSQASLSDKRYIINFVQELTQQMRALFPKYVAGTNALEKKIVLKLHKCDEEDEANERHASDESETSEKRFPTIASLKGGERRDLRDSLPSSTCTSSVSCVCEGASVRAIPYCNHDVSTALSGSHVSHFGGSADVMSRHSPNHT